MKKLAKMSIASALLAGDYLSELMTGKKSKTVYDKRCQEKKIAKRRAKNRRKGK